MAEAKPESTSKSSSASKPSSSSASDKRTGPLATGAQAAAKEGELTAPSVFVHPETGEELATETVETYEEGYESGFVGTKPSDKE
jgi:hypothetical protein